MATKTTWYEQKVFVIFDSDDPKTVAVPEDDEPALFIKAMAKYGWEDDLTCANSVGYVYLRRDALKADRQMSAQADVMDALAQGREIEASAMEELEKFGDETRNRGEKLERTVSDQAKMLAAQDKDLAKLESRDDKLSKRLTKVDGFIEALDQLYAGLERRVNDIAGRYEQTADVEVANPEMLKALVAQVDELKKIVDRQLDATGRLSEVVDSQTRILELSKERTGTLRATEEKLRGEVKGHGATLFTIQRENGQLEQKVKDLGDKLRDAESNRQTLEYRLTTLNQLVDEKIAGAEGGVVKAMETAMPGTRWKVEIEGGER